MSMEAQTRSTRLQVVDHFHRAEAALRRGDTDTAATEFRAILSIEPSNVPALANLGALVYKRGSFAEAKTILQKVLKEDPTLWDAKALLGLAEASMEENSDALSNLQDAFPNIHDPGVKLDAGMALLNLHEQDNTLLDAVGVAQELERVAPSNPEVLYTVYHAYSELAAQALGRLKAVGPNSGRFHEVLAEAALTQDDFPGAIAEFRKAIIAQPGLPGIHYKLGTTLLVNAQDEPNRNEARHEFEAELARDPLDFHSEYELGEVDRLGRQYSSAETHYKRALSLHHDYPDAQAAVGYVLIEQQRYTEALPYLLEATRLDPRNETFHYRLARLYQSLNREEDFRREMDVFSKLHQP
jgi:Predicted N-acetylglucosaminyl transferase